MATTPSGHGYWLVTKDGGVFAEGDAGFFGSLVGSPSALPAIGLVATSDGAGYSVVESNGTGRAFGS